MSWLKKKYARLLSEIGVSLNGDAPGDIKVHRSRLFKRVLINGSLGFGEAYMDKDWDCKSLDIFCAKYLAYKLQSKKNINSFYDLFLKLCSIFLNMQKPSRAFIIGEKHYNTGNDLFEKMLDSYLNYSCGYWKNAKNLEGAQQAKLKLIFEKLKLSKGMRVLDIGCGWGGAAKYAAKKHGVEVVGTTVSSEQAKYAREFCKGLPVDIQEKDYRDLEGKFDRIYSIGMFEHVGPKNYRAYMQVTRQLLQDNGLFLLHTIGANDLKGRFKSEPWIQKYIFPNSALPRLREILDSANNLFIMEDFQNFGPDYDKTLMAWAKNFDNAWDELKDKYDERFYRMWKYYLLSCAGGFRSRYTHLWQFVFSTGRRLERYDSPR